VQCPAAGGISIREDLNFIALHLEVVLQAKRDAWLIFHDQDLCHTLSACGNNNVNVLPCPRSLTTTISPPCAATMWRTIASPTPDPFTLAAIAALPLINFLKIVFLSDAAIPKPLSRTRMATLSRS